MDSHVRGNDILMLGGLFRMNDKGVVSVSIGLKKAGINPATTFLRITQFGGRARPVSINIGSKMRQSLEDMAFPGWSLGTRGRKGCLYRWIKEGGNKSRHYIFEDYSFWWARLTCVHSLGSNLRQSLEDMAFPGWSLGTRGRKGCLYRWIKEGGNKSRHYIFEDYSFWWAHPTCEQKHWVK